MNLDGITFYNAPGDLPDDVGALDDSVYISSAVFAHLAEIPLDSFRSMKTRFDKRRGTDKARAGDFPASEHKIGNSPVWTLGQFRTWKANRPGKGAGGGRREGFKLAPNKRRPPTSVELPLRCPHCDHAVTPADVQAQQQAAWELEQASGESPAIPVVPAASVDKNRGPRALA